MTSKLLTAFCRLTEKSSSRSFTSKKIIAALLFLGAFGVNAQVSSYVTTGTGVGQTWTPITTGGGASTVFGTTNNALLDNIVSGAVPLNFNFNFNGKVYTTCYISFNGFITFGGAPAGGVTGAPATVVDFSPISAPINNFEGVIAAYARDLKGAGLDVLRQTQGSAPNRTFTVQWRVYRSGIANTPIDMQIILHESDLLNPNSGLVEVMYNTNPAGGLTQSTSIPAQVGLRGENNTDFNNKYYNSTAAWPTAAPVFARGTANNLWVNTRFQISCITAPTKLTWIPPTCFAPKVVRATPVSITNTTATIVWTAPNPAPSSGYDYLVTTVAPNNINVTYPIAGTVATGSVGAGVTTASVASLTPNTVYYIYVRGNCGTPGGWSASGTFTTLCNPTSLPYTEGFGGVAVPGIPPCTKVETYGPSTAGYWRSSDPTIPSNWGFVDKHMRITASTGDDDDSTFFTEGVQLTGGTSYRLAYTYGSSGEFATTEQSMSISYGTAPVAAAMTNFVIDYPSFKGGPYTNVINFIPASTGTYYFGFYSYTVAGNATTLLDNIDIRPTTCFPPVLSPATGVTSGSAFISWAAAIPAPANGYEYFYSTSATPPNAATVPSGSTAAGVTSFTLGGLTPLTTYYVWVRSSCGGGDYSNWSAAISFPTQPGPTPPTCVPSGVGYSQDPNGITNVKFSNVDNTTGLEATNYADYSYITGYAGQGTTVPISITYRTGYTYDTMIWIDWNNDGDFVDVTPAVPANELVYTGNSAGTVPAILNASFTIPGTASIGAHRMRIGGMDFGPPALTPCRTGNWQAFEDYTLYVTSPPPAITFTQSPSVPVCQGTPTTVTITSPVANYTSYTWFPATGVTGTAPNFTLNPTATTTYELVGYNGATFHRTSITLTVTVKPTPSPVSISPATLTVCQNANPIPPLTAVGGIISGINIFSENFNGPSAPGWTQQNYSTGGTPAGAEALAAWGLAPDGYAPFGAAFHSNDNSQFAFTESDAPGSSATVHTELLSPPIDLTGYTSATLNFYEYYQQWASDLNDEFRAVDIIAADGVTVLTLGALQNPGNVNIGTPTGFALATVPLTGYVGTTIRLRFRYEADYDWGWAIDNVVVTGSGPSSYTWAPITGLYNDAAGTIAYTGDARATVYPRPTSSTAYTLTATAFACPVVSAPMTVTVTGISGGTMAVTSQTVCGGGAAAPIVLGSVVGPVVYWQYDDDGDFTSGAVTISSTSTTLSSALIGTITGTRYFRAVIQVSGCSDAYSPVHVITVPTAVWNGAWTPPAGPNSTTQAVFNAPYTSSGNLTACSVVVSATAGTVTFNAGHTLTVQNGVTVDNASRLIFNNNSSLVQVNGTTNVGDITYRRTSTGMRKYDYTYWSSPVSAQILATFSPLTMADKYFWFNTTNYQWTAVTAPGSTPMTVGRGYIIRAPESFSTGSTTPFNGSFGYDGITHGGGVPNNGTIPVAVGHNSATNDLDCIGNPYPSAISANLFMGDSDNHAELGATGTTLYFWTHNTPIASYNYNGGDYASYNLSGGLRANLPGACVGINCGVPTGNIAAGQAFMIKTIAAGSVNFKNTMRLTGLNTQFFRMDGQEDPFENFERNRIWLEMFNEEGLYKQLLVGYIQNATNDIEPGFDGELVEAGNPISLYTFAANQKLSIQGRALPFAVTDEIPVGYRSSVAGSFQIGSPEVDGLFTDQDVYLEDTALNIVHDLKQGVYWFTTDAGTFDTRFILRFTNSTLGTQNPAFDQNSAVVYKNDNNIFVETANIKMKSVKIYDLRGRLIAENDAINSNKTEFNNLNASQQVLMVHITSTDNVTVTKKIVF